MEESKFKLWFKRLGLAGFLFFLIKGIIWLFIFYGLGTGVKSCNENSSGDIEEQRTTYSMPENKEGNADIYSAH